MQPLWYVWLPINPRSQGRRKSQRDYQRVAVDALPTVGRAFFSQEIGW
jgi:hypothetical protein